MGNLLNTIRSPDAVVTSAKDSENKPQEHYGTIAWPRGILHQEKAIQPKFRSAQIRANFDCVRKPKCPRLNNPSTILMNDTLPNCCTSTNTIMCSSLTIWY